MNREEVEALREKAQETLDSARLLEESGYYDSAITRYYFFLYQTVLIYQDEYKHGPQIYIRRGNPHIRTFKKFCKWLGAGHVLEGKFNQLRRERNNANYGHNVAPESCIDTYKEFKEIFDDVMNEIEERIEEKDLW